MDLLRHVRMLAVCVALVCMPELPMGAQRVGDGAAKSAKPAQRIVEDILTSAPAGARRVLSLIKADALQRAILSMEQKGWKPTDVFVVFRRSRQDKGFRVVNAALTSKQDESFQNGSGEALI